MYSLVIRDQSGETQTEFFDEEQVLIGRVPGNELVLRAGNVSRQHARLVYRDGRLIVADLGSANGTYVNGRKIRHATILRESDEIWVGDFVLEVKLDTVAAARPSGRPHQSEKELASLWFVSRAGGQTVGPVTAEQVSAGIRAGKVPLDSYACPSTGGDWKPIDQIIDFIGAVRSLTDSLTEAEETKSAMRTEVPAQLASDIGPMTLWYVAHRGTGQDALGPITTDQVRKGVQTGQIPIDCQVNQAGTPQWHDLASVPTFQDLLFRFQRG